MATKISRRAFLKLLSAAGLTGLGFRPFTGEDSNTTANDIARVTVRSVSVYARPSDKSQILFQRYRDELVNIYYEVDSPEGPAYNPIWYRVWGGYMHRANLVRSTITYSPVATSLPSEGHQLAEVTVPFTQAMRYTTSGGWKTLYRLYNSSTHWVYGIEEGPDGEPWYKLIDELLEVDYHVPAMHLRMIQPEEFNPITPDVPQHKKRIKVSIGSQTLTCLENDEPVFETKVSTGLDYAPPGQLAWNTPKGTFYVFSKMPSKHMGDGRLSGNPEDYELPGVPWTTFFETSGVAFHGTYWHDDFGTPRSHGCVNMRSEEAKWLFRWVTPANDPPTIEQRGWGTRVDVS